MPESCRLPISAESDALRETLAVCGDAMGEITLSCALLIDGVLQLVTGDIELTDRTWKHLADAYRSGQPAGHLDQDASLDAIFPLQSRRSPLGGFLIARGPRGPLDPTEVALLRVIASDVAAAAESGRIQAAMRDLLADYMSPDVAEELLRHPGHTSPGGQTRDVSVLFADLEGFTSLSERTHPEAVVALLNRYFSLAVPAIVSNGGTVSAFIGDAIMGLFGAPLTQPEHPLLAARAALALQEAVNGMLADNPELPKLRVGVATGPATVGSIGSPNRRIFTAIGDTVNLASRLESTAAAGTVVISEETHAVIRSFAEVDRLPPITVKGKARPQQTFRLLRLREGSERAVGTGTISINLADLRASEQPDRRRP